MSTKSKIRKLALVALLVVLGSTLFPATSYAEESNRHDVRVRLADGGWNVVYGDLINEYDVYEFLEAIAVSVATENPAPIANFFNNQLQAQLIKMRQAAPEIAEEALVDLLISAFDSDGEVLRYGRLEVSADVATYNRWETVIYHEPRTSQCKQPFPWGGWTWVPCTTMVQVEKTIPLPNNFQPYFRFRWVSTTPVPQETAHGLICLENGTNRDISYSYRWGEGQWRSGNVKANKEILHWWNYAPGSYSSPDFEIRFDSDFTTGTDYKQYNLVRYRASETKCVYGKVYEFEMVGNNTVELYDSD